MEAQTDWSHLLKIPTTPWCQIQNSFPVLWEVKAVFCDITSFLPVCILDMVMHLSLDDKTVICVIFLWTDVYMCGISLLLRTSP